LHSAQIKKSDDLDNACAKSLVLEALLAQAVAMQIISTPGGKEDGSLLQLDDPVQPAKSVRVAMIPKAGKRVSQRGGCLP
jgi:hypothetical protein